MLEWISENTSIISLVTFLLGLTLGNRLAIGRDKRKELNEAAQPIRSWLLAEAEEPNPYKSGPTRDQVDIFSCCLPKLKKHFFLKRFNYYQEVRKNNYICDRFSQASFINKGEVKYAAKKCIPFTKRI